jgi:hypothetical protein
MQWIFGDVVGRSSVLVGDVRKIKDPKNYVRKIFES